MSNYTKLQAEDARIANQTRQGTNAQEATMATSTFKAINVRLATDAQVKTSKEGKQYVELPGYQAHAIVDTNTGEKTFSDSTVRVLVFGRGVQLAATFKKGDFIHVEPFAIERKEGTYEGKPFRPVIKTSDAYLKAHPKGK